MQTNKRQSKGVNIHLRCPFPDEDVGCGDVGVSDLWRPRPFREVLVVTGPVFSRPRFKPWPESLDFIWTPKGPRKLEENVGSYADSFPSPKALKDVIASVISNSDVAEPSDFQTLEKVRSRVTKELGGPSRSRFWASSPRKEFLLLEV